jgi:hypothetical protein
LLEASGAVLIYHREMRPETKVTSVCLSDIDQRADDVYFNTFELIAIVGFHGSDLKIDRDVMDLERIGGREGERTCPL